MSASISSTSITTHDHQGSLASVPRHKYLTRDDRIRIRSLRNEGYTYRRICDSVGCTERQVGYALSHPLTPKKRGGRPPELTKDQVDDIELFVTLSQAGRLMPWDQLAVTFSHFGVGKKAIRTAMKNRGYRRYVARRESPLSPKNRDLRLKWAQEHVHWTFEQWCTILWSDETWVTGGSHRRQWVTRQLGE